MKVLHIVGYETENYDNKLQLARIWQDGQHHVCVEAKAPQFEAFARELQRRIDSRLYSGKNTPIFKMVGWTQVKKDGTVINTDAIHPAQPEDDDFLETLAGDTSIFEMEGVAGYEVHTGANYITGE